LREARAFYDYVIIDTPPVVPLVDCRLLGRLVDGFIVVVAANQTPRKLVAEALNLLDPVKVIGVVFNGDDRPLAAHYGYYGYSQPSGNRAAWWQRVLSMFSALVSGVRLWRPPESASRTPPATAYNMKIGRTVPPARRRSPGTICGTAPSGVFPERSMRRLEEQLGITSASATSFWCRRERPR
jgi:hypothetical protein